MVARSLGKDEAYLTVREVLADASKGVDGVLWREISGFGRYQVCNVRVNIAMIDACQPRLLEPSSLPSKASSCQYR